MNEETPRLGVSDHNKQVRNLFLPYILYKWTNKFFIDLDMKCPSQSPVIKHLITRRWCYLGRWWNLWEVGWARGRVSLWDRDLNCVVKPTFGLSFSWATKDMKSSNSTLQLHLVFPTRMDSITFSCEL